MNSVSLISSLLCQSVGFRISSSRFIHSTGCVYAVEKSLLAKLRKKTGFSISECKKALEQHDNDFDKAEVWINKEAQSKGWAKALNLSSRPATQGLIGVHIQNNVGAIVEVNCETDFVARNEQFQTLVSQIAQEYALFGLTQELSNSTKIHNTKEELDSIQTKEGKKLSDLVALTIGKIGENIRITRGSILRSAHDTNLYGYVHPSIPENPRTFGKFGSLAVFQDPNRDDEIQRNICAHIVGMNPLSIGNMDEEDSSGSDSTSSDSSNDKNTESSDSSSSDSSSDEETKKSKEDETRLVFQEFLSNSDLIIKDVLTQNSIKVVDFIRYECGETVKAED